MVNSLGEALERFISYMTSQGRVCKYEGDVIGVRGAIMKITKVDSDYYCLFFKRDWLHAFKYIFHKADEGWGQTFNMKALRQASMLRGSTLVVVDPKCKFYYAKTMDVLDYILAERTVRVPSTEIGEEGSIPARMLKAEDPKYITAD